MTSKKVLQLKEITFARLQEQYSFREITVRSAVQYFLERIAEIDKSGPSLNSIITTNESALIRADELDKYLEEQGELSGPLHGIVFVIKDNIDTIDMDTTCGNEALLGYRPQQNASVVSRLLQDGAVIIGKSTLPDFATSWFSYSSVSGETKNPYKLNHDPGGSSSGSAAAVAANLAMAGLGTDCGGSIRIPASFCNLIGIRSTPGVVPRTGTGFLVAFQDTVGPLARTVKDAVTIFDTISGYDKGDPFSVSATMGQPPPRYGDLLTDGMKKAKIGLVTNALGDSNTSHGKAVNSLTLKATEDMRAAGAEIIDVEIPDLYQYLVDTSQYIACSRHDIDIYLKERGPISHLRVADLVKEGKYHHKLDLLEAIVEGPEEPEKDPNYTRRYVARDEFLRTILNVMAEYSLDALTFPVTRVPAPSTEEREGWTVLAFPTNTLIASQALMPSITVPAGFTENGVPVGVELVTRPYDEATGFRLAAAYESRNNKRRIPELN